MPCPRRSYLTPTHSLSSCSSAVRLANGLTSISDDRRHHRQYHLVQVRSTHDRLHHVALGSDMRTDHPHLHDSKPVPGRQMPELHLYCGSRPSDLRGLTCRAWRCLSFRFFSRRSSQRQSEVWLLEATRCRSVSAASSSRPSVDARPGSPMTGRGESSFSATSSVRTIFEPSTCLVPVVDLKSLRSSPP